MSLSGTIEKMNREFDVRPPSENHTRRSGTEPRGLVALDGD
jgi:hypothetical protein